MTLRCAQHCLPPRTFLTIADLSALRPSSDEGRARPFPVLIRTAMLFSLIFAGGAAAALRRRELPPLPLSSDDGWILDASGDKFPFVGINWPGHEEAMIPEGLQYQSIASIVSRVSEMGFNSVRLTFATEMVEDILDGGGDDVSLRATLEKALGAENGSRILDRILEHNPSFDADMTRLEVFDAVAAELGRRNILVHLDNHVSKAGWCCTTSDGNGWWGDEHFNASSWVRGLAHMAEHGKAKWPSFASIGLRNELRQGPDGSEPYTWQTWKDRMLEAAEAVHAANPDLLIFFGGRLYSFDLMGPVAGRVPTEPDFRFSIAELPFSRRFVFEQHQYDQGQVASGDCATYYLLLSTFGSGAPTAPEGQNRAPLVMSEWGHDQADNGGAWNGTFRKCVADYMVNNRVGWMMWVLGGSYYIREGEQDRDEPWGESSKCLRICVGLPLLTLGRTAQPRLGRIPWDQSAGTASVGHQADISGVQPDYASGVGHDRDARACGHDDETASCIG